VRFTFEEDFVQPNTQRRKSDPGLDSYINSSNLNQGSTGGMFNPIGQTIVYPNFIHDRSLGDH
jgi:hypothetical protein